MTTTDPFGMIVPPAPAVAVIVYFLTANVAVTVVFWFIVTEQVGEVPVQPPDQPEKVAFAFGMAVGLTPVPFS